MKIFSKTDQGKERTHNEDCVLHNEDKMLIAVADGVGGHNAGELASKKAVEILIRELNPEPKIITPKYLAEIVYTINDEIFAASLSNAKHEGMCSTLVFALKRKNRMYLVNIGDSRGYLFRDKKIIQITIDHSHVQELLSKGEITAEEVKVHPLRNVITKSLGVRQRENPDIFDVGVENGDIYLLCSDGLTNMVNDTDISEIIAEHYKDIKRMAEQLINKANENGGRDNISVAIMKIEDASSDY